jgi:hypothetical protein
MTEDLKKLGESIRNTKHRDRITGSLASWTKVDCRRVELDQRLRTEHRVGKDLCKEARDIIQKIVGNQISTLSESLLKLNLLLSMLEEQRSTHPERDMTLDQMIAEADAILERTLPMEKQAADLIESVNDLLEKLTQGPPDTQARDRSA